VPGAEYDRDPRRIEWQARLIASTPALRQIARELLVVVVDSHDSSPALDDLVRKVRAIERFLSEVPEPEEQTEAAEVA